MPVHHHHEPDEEEAEAQEAQTMKHKALTLKERGFYTGRLWRRCRQLALHRDKYMCQDCKAKGKVVPATEVHHVIPLEDRPDLALELSNLRCLCHDCHEKTKHKAKTKAREGMRVIKIQ
jgi:5-methylcytosine-specific restriction endonuclease McrA